MARSTALQSVLRSIPRQRQALICVTFKVEPPTGEPLEMELWAEDFATATRRATHLAQQAYGSGTTVSCVRQDTDTQVVAGSYES